MVTKEQRDEIKTYYRGCLDPKKQIGIICELFPHLKKAEILEVLGVDGKEDKVIKKTKKQEIKEEEKGMSRVVKSYEENVHKDICNAVLNEGLSHREAAERFGVPCGNVSRWVTKAKEQQAEFLNYGEEKKEQAVIMKNDAEKIHKKAKEDALVSGKSNDKSNDFSLGIGEVLSLGILNEEEMEHFKKIALKLEIFNKGYRYAKDNGRHEI